MTLPAPREPQDLDDATVHTYATTVAAAWLGFAGMHALGGRPITALAHVAASVVSLAARFFVGRGGSGRTAAIITLATGSLAGLAAAAILSGDPRGPAVTLLALVPLLSGVIRIVPLRRAVLLLAIATTIWVPLVASRTAAIEPLVLGLPESIVLSVGLGVLVYRLGSEWRHRSDEHVRRLALQQTELEAQKARMSADAVALGAARDAAVRASAAKSQFVAMTSHEIRGPLNGLVGLSHALSDTELSPHQRGIVQALRSSSDALTRVVGELLDLARVEAGKLELAPSMVDVRALCEDVADTFSAATLEKDLEVIALVDESVPEGVTVDGTRLRQVVANLVGNAVKFTDRGHVLISARSDGRTLWVAVSDTGRGITTEDRERLFAPFEQVSDRLLDRQAGTGLGLWLARMFVEAMGGVLEARSEVGAGSTFELRIPCRRVTVPEIDRPVPLPAATVLAVVSSPVVGRALVAAATRLGLAATVVLPDGPLPAPETFDHVIIDIDDPAQEARIVAARRAARRTTAAYLAASPRRLARAEGLARRHELGGVLLKPMRASRLAALVSQAGPARGASSSQILIGDLLIVDDEPINRIVARHLASPMGLTVSEAASGAEALSWLSRNRCDVVLVDLHMDGMDGAETAERIRAAHGATPIVIGYSGVVRDEERRRFHGAGVADVLGKPLERATFESTLRAAVGRARRRQTNAGMKAAVRAAGVAPAAAAPAAIDGPARGSPAAGPARLDPSPGPEVAAEVRTQTLALGPATSVTTLESGRLRELVKFVGEGQARALAAEFLSALDERVTSLTQGAREGRAGQVEAGAHKLASAAATFGMADLADACRAAEAGASAATPGELERIADRLEAVVAPSRVSLARALDEWPP